MVLRFVFIRKYGPTANVAEEAPIVVTVSRKSIVMIAMESVYANIVGAKFTVSFAKVLPFVLTTRFDTNVENVKANDFVNTAKTKLIANLAEVFSFAKVQDARLRNLKSSRDIVFSAI